MVELLLCQKIGMSFKEVSSTRCNVPKRYKKLMEGQNQRKLGIRDKISENSALIFVSQPCVKSP